MSALGIQGAQTQNALKELAMCNVRIAFAGVEPGIPANKWPPINEESGRGWDFNLELWQALKLSSYRNFVDEMPQQL
jgi:hypothetical protein